MKRYTTIGFLMGAAILANVGVASAQRWGREATPRSGVCFYENINFDGRYFCSPVGATTSSVPSGMNDRISSVRLFGNAAVTLFRDPDFRGQAKNIDSNISDLRAMGFNDRVSSYRVDTSRGFVGNRNGNGNGIARGRVQNGSRWNYGDAEALVRRSYHSVLGRDPDASGLRSWTNQVMSNNWTQRDLENALRQSDGYRALRNNGRRR